MKERHVYATEEEVNSNYARNCAAKRKDTILMDVLCKFRLVTVFEKNSRIFEVSFCLRRSMEVRRLSTNIVLARQGFSREVIMTRT